MMSHDGLMGRHTNNTTAAGRRIIHNDYACLVWGRTLGNCAKSHTMDACCMMAETPGLVEFETQTSCTRTTHNTYPLKGPFQHPANTERHSTNHCAG